MPQASGAFRAVAGCGQPFLHGSQPFTATESTSLDRLPWTALVQMQFECGKYEATLNDCRVEFSLQRPGLALGDLVLDRNVRARLV